MKKQKRRSKYIPPKTKLDKRADAIKSVLAIALYNESKALSMRQIAQRMDYWPGSRLMGFLYDMASNGEVLMKAYPHGKGERYTFTLPAAQVAKAAAKAWAA